jgi:putative ABC transport system ATP-binding protein
VSDAADTSVLRARGLRKEYGKGEGLVRAVDGVDLDTDTGETVAVMGPSGCGKSTLLHLLGGLDRPSGGEVSLNGRRIDDIGEKALARMRRTAAGFVFQAFHLMEELTAIENVELPALLAGRSPRVARRRAEDLLEQVGLTDRVRFQPAALSGGQRQRVAIARALSNEPLVVLADEPTGNLDSAATLASSSASRACTSQADAGYRHPRCADRGHRGPDDLDARRRVRGRDPVVRRQHRAARRPRRAGGLMAMGRILLVGRLAVRDLLRCPTEAALLLLAIMAATTTLSLGSSCATRPVTRTSALGRRPTDLTWSPASASPPSFSASRSWPALPVSSITVDRTRSPWRSFGHPVGRLMCRPWGAPPPPHRSTSLS